MRSGLLAGIRWSVCMLKAHRNLCESFSRTGAGLCIYHLFVWSNWSPCRPILLLLFLASFSQFSRVFQLMVFHWSLGDSKSPQVSRNLLSILNNAAVWVVLTRPLISNSSSSFQSLWGLFQAHQLQQVLLSLLCSIARFKYLSLFSFSSIFTL